MRRLSVAVLISMSATVLAGCVEAPSEPGQARTARPTPTMPRPTVRPTRPPQLVDAIEAAVLAKRTVAYEITGRNGGDNGPTFAEVSGEYRFNSRNSVDFDAFLSLEDREGETKKSEGIGVGSAFFLKPPPDSGLPRGKSWIRRDRDDWEDPQVYRPLYNEAIRSVDGIQDWSMLAGAAKLKPIGRRTIGDVETTGHQARINILDAMPKVDDGSRRVLSDLYAQGARSIGFTVWVDKDYLPRAVLVNIELKSRLMLLDVRYRGWGKQVTIAEPPAAQVWRRS
ncbi:MAG: hypothetical protein GEV11_24430 [Streptosporangiales bacterium]|nr:hypothetical protein [Streptosporangiales bacterium]